MLPSPAPESAVVLMDANLFALVPTHHYAGIHGNCLVIPRGHYENALDMPDELGREVFRATRRLAHAMLAAFGCEGISTRQHNGPAGNQDVWHYHLHVFPRYANDRLYGGAESALRHRGADRAGRPSPGCVAVSVPFGSCLHPCLAVAPRDGAWTQGLGTVREPVARLRFRRDGRLSACPSLDS
ncbi:HIT domain-containing protein [Xanthomonas translucens pv. undulosa]|uniref:HIT family protein n=1 Tax=Xanthomonas campestris pv. translucens TaxID=343 RepID=UPI003CE73DD6